MGEHFQVREEPLNIWGRGGGVRQKREKMSSIPLGKQVVQQRFITEMESFAFVPPND